MAYRRTAVRADIRSNGLNREILSFAFPLTCSSAQRLTPGWIRSRSDVISIQGQTTKQRALAGKHSVRVCCL